MAMASPFVKSEPTETRDIIGLSTITDTACFLKRTGTLQAWLVMRFVLPAQNLITVQHRTYSSFRSVNRAVLAAQHHAKTGCRLQID